MHPLLFSLKKRYNKEKLPDPFAYLFKWFGRTPTGVFQVGANSGQEIKGFIEQGIKAGILVEPLPSAYKELEKRASSQPGYFTVKAVCTDVAGKTCNFYVSKGGGGSSSLLKPSGHLVAHPEVDFDSAPITLVSTTVDQIAADFKTNGHADMVARIDLLYIDTQGAELRVLKGANAFLKQVRYVFTEVSNSGLYENDVSHKELTEYLDSHGFSLVFLYINKTRWGDALYVHNSIFDA
ncbi:MAG: FkbM family methyltransferase [Deltaproteobacteria bacterium]|nr:FkbM family methyltransferase [Deltaproteobacteria bacterium]